ncbi:MAG: hypothetical protein D6737_20670 [Chloroflexi bacterium]|nr:MAG: hypothetical protein D6737_20670 [Chloroflexota bacterium]
MAREKMLEARRLIQEKDYEAARALLKTIDHPKAREWEARLDQIAPAQSTPQQRTQKAASGGSSRGVLLAVIGVVLVVIIVIVIAVVVVAGGSDDDEDTATDETTTAQTTGGEADGNAQNDGGASQDDTKDTGDGNVASGGDRPANVPAVFPFPTGGFTPVLDNSEGDEVFVSVSVGTAFADLESFYRTQLPNAGYQIITDVPSADATILSIVGDELQGSVRLTRDGLAEGESRITISLEPREADILTPGASSANSEPVESNFDDPVTAVEAFMTAVFDNDVVTAIGIVCPALRSEIDEQILLSLRPQIPSGQIDSSGLETRLLTEGGGVAQVEVSGTVVVTVSDVAVPVEFPPLVLDVTNDNGWKVCPRES